MRILKIFYFLFFLINISLSAQEMQEYHIKKGETLKDVADKFDVSYITLLRENKDIALSPKENTIVKVPIDIFKKTKRPYDLRDSIGVENIKAVLPVQKDSMLVHKVLPKETLYSLSKRYQVSMSDLIKQNKFLAVEGLRIGQELQVPNQEKQVGVNTHTVLPKETLYGISKKYNVSIEALRNKNKEKLSQGLSMGTVLIIPNNKLEVFKKDPKKHIISQGETLYSVSRKYGISVPELLKVNKGVKVDSLTIGSVLDLPAKVVVKVDKAKITPIYKLKPLKFEYDYRSSLPSVLKELQVSEDSLRSINPLFDSIVQNGGDLLIGFEKQHLLFDETERFQDVMVKDTAINVMLLLPFDFKKNDTLAGETLFKKEKGLPSIVADFYLGAEIALDSLKKQGIQIQLSVIDTEKQVKVIAAKLSKLKALQPDVIIGPLYTEITKYVAANFPTTPVYYPIFSKNQITLTQENIYKTVPKKQLFEKTILAYIKENRKGEHLVIVGKEENLSQLRAYKNALVKRNTSEVIIENDVTILTPSDGYISNKYFLEKVKLEQENWFLITDSDNVMTADVFNNAKAIPRDSILETPIKIISFEKSEDAEKMSNELLSKYNYVYATDNLEYLEFLNKNFEQAYVRKNNTFPSKYAINGFNVTYDAILRSIKGADSEDAGKASYRFKQAFYYQSASGKTNENQAVFVNTIQSTKEKGLQIIRLR